MRQRRRGSRKVDVEVWPEGKGLAFLSPEVTVTRYKTESGEGKMYISVTSSDGYAHAEIGAMEAIAFARDILELALREGF